jgi:hypothetical protein
MWALVSIVFVYVSLPLCFWNLNISLYWSLCCNQRIYVITHFYAGYVYVMYYFAIITSIMMPCDDPGKPNHPCLRVGCHKTCNPRLLVHGVDRTQCHLTSWSSDHQVLDLCRTILDPLHQVSYSCLDPSHCLSCRTCHLHITRQANVFLHIK